MTEVAKNHEPVWDTELEQTHCLLCGKNRHNHEKASAPPEIRSTDGLDAKRLEYILSYQHRVPTSGAFYFDGIRNGESLSREVIDRAMASIVADERPAPDTRSAERKPQ